MRYSPRYTPLAGVVVAAAVLVAAPLAPRALAHPAVPLKKAIVSVHLTISGGYHYAGTLSHGEDATTTIPAKYACVKFTHPNFATRVDPRSYALNFDNPGVTTSTGGVFLSFYYNPRMSGYQRVDGKGGGVALFVVPAPNKSFGLGRTGSYKIRVRLARDGRSGSFMATGLRNLIGVEKNVSVVGRWTCSKLFIRTR